jgi:hypothetical protein
MSISSLGSIVSSGAAPYLQPLQQAASAQPAANSATAPTFADILSGIGNTSNPLNFISTPANDSSSANANPPTNTVLGELTSLLSSV